MAKIFIRPDGVIEGLYSDAVPLNNLGRLNVKRATHVEFDEVCQEWIVMLPDGKKIYSNPSREEALDWERNYCDRLLIAGYRVNKIN